MPELQSTSLRSTNYCVTPSEGQNTAPSLVRTQPAKDETAHGIVHGIRRLVYIVLAGLFFILGVIGIVVPGLPTTPFLLLTSYYLTRSWPQMHRMLLAHRILGPVLRQWQQHRAVDPRIKRRAVALVVLVMGLLVCFSNLPTVLLATVMALASIGLFVIYRLPTVPDKVA